MFNVHNAAIRPVHSTPQTAVTTPPRVDTRPMNSPATLGWNGGSGLDAGAARTSTTVRPPAPKPGFPAEVNQARVDLAQQTYRQYMADHFQLYRHLPPEDQAELRAEAQRRADGAVARFDQIFSETRTQYHNLPEEDANAAALSIARARMAANGGVALDPEASYVSQRDGFPGGKNNNCGFASSLAVMQYLGVQVPEGDADVPRGESETYHQVMILRDLAGAGNSPANTTDAPTIAKGLNEAGANATVIRSSPEWKADHSLAVDWMKRQFLDQRNGDEAFIVGGQPGGTDGGWPEYSDYGGSHWVAVVDYDPATNTFTVLDPYPGQEPGGPIQVTPEQLQTYMEDDGIQNNEIVQVRP